VTKALRDILNQYILLGLTKSPACTTASLRSILIGNATSIAVTAITSRGDAARISVFQV
jgi:hypothetical protein